MKNTKSKIDKDQKVKIGLKKIIKLKKSYIPKERQEIFKLLEKPLKALAKSLLKHY